MNQLPRHVRGLGVRGQTSPPLWMAGPRVCVAALGQPRCPGGRILGRLARKVDCSAALTAPPDWQIPLHKAERGQLRVDRAIALLALLDERA